MAGFLKAPGDSPFPDQTVHDRIEKAHMRLKRYRKEPVEPIVQREGFGLGDILWNPPNLSGRVSRDILSLLSRLSPLFILETAFYGPFLNVYVHVSERVFPAGVCVISFVSSESLAQRRFLRSRIVRWAPFLIGVDN